MGLATDREEVDSLPFFSLVVVFVGGLLVKLKGVGSVFCLSGFGVDLTLTAAPFE